MSRVAEVFRRFGDNYIAKFGIISVLHTWSRIMDYHPHLHCLVPGGGISDDGCQWLWSHPKFIVPRDALCDLFREKFMAMAKNALPDIDFPKSVWDKRWGVDLRVVDNHPEKVIEYLGRYIHRVAISNSRIEAIDDDSVTIRSQNSKTRQWKSTLFEPVEFIRRFLQHVLPKLFTLPEITKNKQKPHESTEGHPLCPNCETGRLSIRVELLPLYTGLPP
jgi:hypothetical protein